MADTKDCNKFVLRATKKLDRSILNDSVRIARYCFRIYDDHCVVTKIMFNGRAEVHTFYDLDDSRILWNRLTRIGEYKQSD